MDFFDIFKGDLEELEFKCYFTKAELYLMGIRGLNHCSQEQIIVYLKKRKFEIMGNHLEIEELSKGEIRIKGQILGIKLDE